MKRFNDGHSNAPFKRPKMGPDDIELRVLIPSKVHFCFLTFINLNIQSAFGYILIIIYFRLLARLLVRVDSTFPDCVQT